MAYQGVVSAAQVTNQLNNVHYDAKASLRRTQSDINTLISDLGNPAVKFLTIDGRKISKEETLVLQIAVSDKLEHLSTQATTILSVFSEMFKLEKTLGGVTS